MEQCIQITEGCGQSDSVGLGGGPTHALLTDPQLIQTLMFWDHTFEWQGLEYRVGYESLCQRKGYELVESR